MTFEKVKEAAQAANVTDLDKQSTAYTLGFVAGRIKSGANMKKRELYHKGSKTDNGHRRPFVGGNFKCNSTRSSLRELIDTFNEDPAPSGVEQVVFPPALYLHQTADSLQGPIAVGAQNCWHKQGAFTGEMTPQMIQDNGIPWVLIGHSERRTIFGESESVLYDKAVAALKVDGLSVVFCIGEKLEDRQSGADRIREVLFSQLKTLVTATEAANASWDNIVIAYEPVWAIGTGVTATPEQANETHSWIRDWLHETCGNGKDVRIVYGGSVKEKNCKSLAKCENIDGFLVGGASLKPEFMDIVRSLQGRL
eukprot:g6537.t1